MTATDAAALRRAQAQAMLVTAEACLMSKRLTRQQREQAQEWIRKAKEELALHPAEGVGR